MSELLYINQFQSLELEDILSFKYEPNLNRFSLDAYRLIFNKEPGDVLTSEQLENLLKITPKIIFARFQIESISESKVKISGFDNILVVQVQLRPLITFYQKFDLWIPDEVVPAELIFKYTSEFDRIYLKIFNNKYDHIFVEKKYLPKPNINWNILTRPILNIGDYWYAEYEFTINQWSTSLYEFFISNDSEFLGRKALYRDFGEIFLFSSEVEKLYQALCNYGIQPNSDSGGVFKHRFFGQVKSIDGEFYLSRLFLPEIHSNGISQEDVEFKLFWKDGSIHMSSCENELCNFTSLIYFGN